MDDIDPVTLAWIAGLLEGEGNFGCRRGSTGHHMVPSIQCRMTDEDIIRTLQAVTGAGSVNGPYSDGNPNHKPVWRWQITGPRAIALMKTLRPWMGRRRGGAIDSILAQMRQT